LISSSVEIASHRRSHVTWLDRLLQQWRIRVARRQLPPGSRVLDIGTHDGALFRLARARGMGIDPELLAVPAFPGVTLVKGFFPADLPTMPDESFDAVTALAVVEHVPEAELRAWAEAVARLVVPHGVLVITVPVPAVDTILHVLIRLHLIAGMEAHQHHRFRVRDVDSLFTAPLWRRIKHRTFQLGLNHLYVLERTPHPVARSPRPNGSPSARQANSASARQANSQPHIVPDIDHRAEIFRHPQG
jgi:SAM-dependent methyltransferase